MNQADKEPKIHVDAEWKRRAREEKEQAARLAGEKEGGGGPGPGAGPATPPPGGTGRLPAASFLTHISQLATEAAVALGEVPHPATGERRVDLELARYLIDTLAMLHEKTAGHRTPTETRALEETLYRLRLRFVELTGGPEPPRPGGGG